MEDSKNGSLTVEAALGLSLFVFTVICLIMPLKMLDTQRRVQMVLESCSKELSQYAYIQYRISQGEEPELDQNQGGEDAALALFTRSAAELYLRKKIGEAVGSGAVTGLDFSQMDLDEEDGRIDLWVSYRMKLPFSVFTLDSVPAFSRSMRRGWIGREGGKRDGQDREDEENQTVYVGNNMSRYHWFADCHYIFNEISSLSFEDVKNRLSISGRHYKPCGVCGGKAAAGSEVYILPNGKYYHSDANCSSLASYVRKVPLKEVEYLGECSYCRRKKG